jgi:hypothetical protein
MDWLRSRSWIVGAFALALLSACGGGTQSTVLESTPREEISAPPPPTPVHARGDREVRVRVGRAGGTLELANGARLEIPEEAIASEVEISFRVAPPAREAWDDETKRALGPSLEIEPAIRAQSGQFRISCPASPIPPGFDREDLALGTEEEAGATLGGATMTRWQMWPARVEGNRFVADMPAFPGQRVQFGVSR